MKVINIQDIDTPEDCATYDELVQFADKIAELAVNYLEVAEPKRGRWIEKKDFIYCSECGDGFDAIYKIDYRYCPNCGADMRGGQE